MTSHAGGRDDESPAPVRVVVTGLGPITAAGTGVEELWRGLRSRRSRVGTLTRFDASAFRTTIAAEIHDFEPERHMERQRARRLDRFGQFSIAASRLALEDARLDSDTLDGDRVAVQMGSALGGLAHAQEAMAGFLAHGPRAVDARLATTVFCGAASCQAAIEFGFTGPNATNAMSCASGTIAIGEAWRLLREGIVDVALAGGIEAPLGPLSFGAFAIIRAMSTRNDDPTTACRPFDRDRDGFVMGEGAAVLVLESLEHARARGARIYAEVAGYGTTADAFHMTAPRPDGSRAAAAMRTALRTAGVPPEAVGWVSAHASSTPLNDGTEALALTNVLGAALERTPVSGTKPYHGHALGASGAIEAAIACMVMRRGWIPPTLNLETPGEDCALDHVTGDGRSLAPDLVLSNSFGFGGVNASLVLRALPAERRVTAP
jgi:3-oxoacyl-[acyl-carrier-protein] synthase II